MCIPNENLTQLLEFCFESQIKITKGKHYTIILINLHLKFDIYWGHRRGENNINKVSQQAYQLI